MIKETLMTGTGHMTEVEAGKGITEDLGGIEKIMDVGIEVNPTIWTKVKKKVSLL